MIETEEEVPSPGQLSSSTSEFLKSAIITINEQGYIQSVDKGACQMFGYELSELMGEKLNGLLPQPYCFQHDYYLARYKRTHEKHIIGKKRLLEAQHKNGSIFPIWLQVSEVVMGGCKLFVGMIELAEDTHAVITANTSGTIIGCNKNCEAIWGYVVNELVGQNFAVLLPPLYRENSLDYLKGYISTKGKNLQSSTRYLPCVTKTGETVPISLRVSTMKVGEVEFYKIRVDKIFKDTEVALSLSPAGLIRECNTLFVQTITGYSPQELVGQHLSLLCPGLFIRGRKRKRGEIIKGDSLEEKTTLDHLSREEFLSITVRHKDGSEIEAIFELGEITENDIMGRIRMGKEVSSIIKEEGEPTIKQIEKAKAKGERIGNYSVKGVLGQGTYGKVKMGEHTDTGEEVAIKIMNLELMDEAEKERAHRELEIHKKIQHPHIVRLYEALETETRLFIIMELVPGGELLSYITGCGALTEAESRRIFLQIVSAVKYLHNNNIIHRDIKHKNILIDKDKNIKLIDFGLSNYIETQSMRTTFCGTPAYAAPEMILAREYNGPEVDVWSLGVVLFSMIVGKFPFRHVADIIEGKFELPPGINPVIKDLLQRMLSVEPKKRATLEAIEKHPWLAIDTTFMSNPQTTENIANGSGESAAEKNLKRKEIQDWVKEIRCCVISTENPK